MLLDPRLVQDTMARARRSRFDPKETSRRIGEGAKPRDTTESQRQGRYSQLLAETGDASYARRELERVIRGNDLVSVNYLAKGAAVARSVCRIRLRTAAGDTVGFGTGFMIAPGVLLTNHHVIDGSGEASNALAEFDYEVDLNGKTKVPVTFALLGNPAPITDKTLDFTLVAVTPSSLDGGRALSDFGWIGLNPTPGKAFIGEYLTIIQHPGGERKQVCVRENKLLKYDESEATVWYETDTVGGSSGSPVFNGAWQVVALHHSGVPKTDAQGRWLTLDGRVWDASMDESQVAWIANEGIRVSRIMTFLRDTAHEHPLAAAVLEQLAAPVNAGEASPVPSVPSPKGTYPMGELRDGELRVTVPIHIALRVGDHAHAADSRPFVPATTPATATPAAAATRADANTVESVDVDQSAYGKRLGYQPNFLGTSIPLPRVDPKRGLSVLTFKEGRKTSSELKYWNYSVVMCKQRRLALLTAVNVDARQRPTNGGREGDRWFFDSRIPATAQIGPEFYGQQKTFEVDRSNNPFDRGHLVRRLDAQWGKDTATQKRNGDDSFHWTNCAPQHYKFNQGAKRWLGLEDYVIKGFASETGRAAVFNGPIFDAPLSELDDEGGVTLRLRGKAHPDPTFGDVKIPKLFFKVVACKTAQGKLAAAAFILSQEDFLITTERVRGLEALSKVEARLFQVRIPDVERLAGISFGRLATAEIRLEEALATMPRALSTLDDIQL